MSVPHHSHQFYLLFFYPKHPHSKHNEIFIFDNYLEILDLQSYEPKSVLLGNDAR